MAKRRNIRGRSRMGKWELIEAIRRASGDTPSAIRTRHRR
jgi:hypothetical protein